MDPRDTNFLADTSGPGFGCMSPHRERSICGSGPRTGSGHRAMGQPGQGGWPSPYLDQVHHLSPLDAASQQVCIGEGLPTDHEEMDATFEEARCAR